MYGRSNIFTRSSASNNSGPVHSIGNSGYNSGGNGYNQNSGYNAGYNSNTGYNSNFNNSSYNSPSGYNNSNSNSYRQGGQLGSYRTDYKYEEPPSYISMAVPVWKDYPPATILAKEEVLHFTPTELRIEDYYLMQKRNLKPIHEEKLREAIRKQCFNQQILKFECKLPPISQERGEDIDALRSGRNQSGYNSNGYNSGGYNSGGYANNSGYNTRGNETANIFNRNSNSSTNVFMNNSNSNSNSNNIFANRNGVGSSYNSGYNNSSNNGYNSNTANNGYNSSNNLFANNSNLNRSATGNNIFGNNGNNVSGGSNIFNNGGNRNIFGNSNNGAGNNAFNQNNNRNNLFGNNMFNNNNNNGGYNIFGNRNVFGSNGQNNNIFANNTNNMSNMNNNNLFANNPNVVDNLQQFLQENRQFLQIISSKITQQSPPPPTTPPPPLYQPLFKEEDPELFEIDSWVKPEPPPERVIKINKSQKYKDTMSEGGGRSQLRDNLSSSRITSNGGRKITYSRVVNKSYQIEEEEEQLANSRIGSNLAASELRSRNERSPARSRRLESQNSRIINQKSILNGSRVLNNQPQNLRESYSMRTGQFQNEFSVDPSLVSETPCQCRTKLTIVWEDDISNGMKKVDFQETLQLPNFNPADEQWQRQLVTLLKERHPEVRKNSQLVILNCGKEAQKQSFLLEGELHQRIFNIDDSYRVNYSLLRNSYASNLSISNEFGTVSWERPINVEQIDFKDEDEFALEDNTISCDLSALRGKCRVTFNNIPQAIKAKMGGNLEEARAHFASIVEKHSEGRFRLEDMWQEGEIYGWSMMVTAFSE